MIRIDANLATRTNGLSISTPYFCRKSFAVTRRLVSLDKALDDPLRLLHPLAADSLSATFPSHFSTGTSCHASFLHSYSNSKSDASTHLLHRWMPLSPRAMPANLPLAHDVSVFSFYKRVFFFYNDTSSADVSFSDDVEPGVGIERAARVRPTRS